MAIIYLNQVLDLKKTRVDAFHMGLKNEMTVFFTRKKRNFVYESTRRQLFKDLPRVEGDWERLLVKPEVGEVWRSRKSAQRDSWVLFREDDVVHGWELEAKVKEHLLADASYAPILAQYVHNLRPFISNFVTYLMVNDWENVDSIILDNNVFKQHVFMELHL